MNDLNFLMPDFTEDFDAPDWEDLDGLDEFEDSLMTDAEWQESLDQEAHKVAFECRGPDDQPTPQPNDEEVF